MIAVTGSSGYLGQYLFQRKKIYKLKRNFFNKKICLENPEYFIHLAALNVFECNKSLEKSKKINHVKD